MSSAFKRIPFGVLMFFIYLGCANEPDCDQQLPHNDIVVAFYDIDDVESPKRNRFEIEAVETDFEFYSRSDSLFNFELALNPAQDIVTFFFQTGVGRDTLILSYEREMRWLSDDCGPHVSYSNLDLVSSTFDSTVIANPQINRAVDESVRIYN